MPFENPTQFSNFVEVIFILLIPAAATAQYGRMVGNRRQGWALYATMLVFLGRPVRRRLCRRAARLSGTARRRREHRRADGTTGGNLEGKDQRNGIADSAQWANVTTEASNGSVNSSHDSYTGFGSLVPLTNMMTGEVIFGGVGSGLYGMLLTVLLAVFIAGLMVGRTPEYLGKKVESREMKLVLIGLLFTPMVALIATGIAISSKYGSPSIFNPGPRGSRRPSTPTRRRRTTTARPSPATPASSSRTHRVTPGSYGITFADILGGLSMLTARFVPLLSALAVAGSLSMKRIVPVGPGTFRTDNPDLRDPADRGDRDRRRPHLLPRRPPRPGRPGPHRPTRIPH